MTGVSDVPVWWLFMACWFHIAVVGGFVKAAIEIIGKVKGTGKKQGDEEFRDEVDEEEEKAETEEKDAESSTLSSPALESNATPPARLPRKFRLLPLHPLNSTAALNAALLFYTRSLSFASHTAWRENSPMLWCMLATLIICGVLFAKSLNVFVLAMSHRTPQTSEMSKTEGERDSRLSIWLRRFANLGFLFIARGGMRWIAGQDVLSLPSADDCGNLEIASMLTDPGTDDPWPDRKVFDRAMGAIPDWVGHAIMVVNLCFVTGCWLKQRTEKQRQKRAEEMKVGAGEE